jgi:enoyl-CoA hydratase/carnithine racemase
VGEFVRLEVEDGVGTIRLDRPKMNALDAAMQDEIRAIATEAAERDDVRAVVVYGGERVFAAGADIKEMADMSYTDMVSRSGDLQASFTAVAEIPKPVVAAVTGYALGGGCELALCADFRIAADNATLGQPEILLGVIPGAGGTQRLTRLVGPSKAKDIIFSGRFVKAEEALQIGLVDRVVPADSVYAEAVAWAKQFSGAAAYAVRASAAPPPMRSAPPRRPSTAASRSTWRPGWRSSACSSRACSPPTTAESACARSSRTDPARHSSPAVDARGQSRRSTASSPAARSRGWL